MDEITRPEFETAIGRLSDEDHRASKRLDTLEDTVRQINDLTVNIGKIATNVETLTKEMTAQGKRLETLESRDGEKWRNFLGYLITAVIGVVIGVVVTAIGL